MPGFIISIKKPKEFDFNDEKLVINNITTHEYIIEQRTVNKFLSDKLFDEDNDIIILVDGIILNKNELLAKQHSKSWFQTIKYLYIENKQLFINELKGSFSIVIYDKQINKWFVFSDQVGSKPVYYYYSNELVLIASDVDYITEVLKSFKIKYNLDVCSAYCILSYGYVLDDHTLINEIKRLSPGSYLSLDNHSKAVVTEYFRFSNRPDFSKNEIDYIELMDYHFRQAVKMQFDKDNEYGYSHLVALSGGLDSRMTTWIAHELGYRNIVNFTFSQTGYYDEIIPKKITSDLSHEWIFKSLDNGIFLTDVAEYPKITGGNVLYFGLAHANSIFKYLNFEKFGLIHSGQLGDVVFATFYSNPKHGMKAKAGDGVYSSTLLNRLNDFTFNEYENQEIYNFYNRGFRGANMGLLSANQYTETFSPFYNPDLLNFALTIPVNMRFNHEIYKKWIQTRYPLAANYIWGKANAKISDFQIKYRGRSIYLNKLLSKISNKLLKSFNYRYDNTINKSHMNPYGYWMKTNPILAEFIDNYFKDHVNLIENSILKKDCSFLFIHGSSIEKLMVISLLSSLKYFEL